jgi:hypothetical protein
MRHQVWSRTLADCTVNSAPACVQVISAEANFVRVNITRLGDDDEAADADAERRGSHSTASTSAQKQQLQPPRTQLLCTVRALLKKVGVRVLVGDHVRMSGIDWREGRGVVDSAAPRSSELTDPAIANVDHVLLLFGLTQPPVRQTSLPWNAAFSLHLYTVHTSLAVTCCAHDFMWSLTIYRDYSCLHMSGLFGPAACNPFVM